MVTPRQKPDSSYASTHMTKTNYTGGHLLSTFRIKPNIEPTPKPEPATDDEPISSSDEEIKSSASLDGGIGNGRTPRQSRPTLEEKLGGNSQGNGRSSQTPRSKKTESPKSQGSSCKRALNVGVNNKEGHDDHDLFSDIQRSSQAQKRHKAVEYGSRRKSSGGYSRTPSSSITPLRTDSPSSGRKPKSVGNSPKASRKTKKGESDSPKDGFKVPMDLDVPSPPAKSRTPPTFKAPPHFPTDAISSSSFAPSSAWEPPIFGIDDGEESPLSSAPSILSLPSSPDNDILDTKESLCPWCKEPVDPELLMRFQSQPKQRIREQQRFCGSHKKTKAQEEWLDKGYPTIDWDMFEDRILGHFDDLENILVPDSQSYYRNILDSTLKSGKAKNFRLTLEGDGLETISCGYYGTRGAGKMLEALTKRFSRKLRRLAASDHIIKSAGVVGYAQNVLVPELAVRLVKEDMGVNEDTARQILRDSIDIGERLNFALNDKVPIPVEVEGGGSVEEKENHLIAV
ncbi:hypothetical protein BBP40_010590 [Aspergillus hancockii]|nr:hypothetical protein BBP40_010590 [Aspergillus hancockii]